MRTTIMATAIVSVVALAGCSTTSSDATESSPQPTSGSALQGAISVPLVVGSVPISSTDPESIEASAPVPPTRLRAGEIDLSMPVAPVGVEPDGTMEIPASAATAGWYRFGATPGSETGNVVLAAHVDDATIGLGPFSRIKELDKGDTVTVTLDDGTEAEYRVTRNEQTSKQDVDMSLVFEDGDSQQLVLVTCGGRFDWDTRHYEDNVMVWAEPVGS